MEDLAQVSKNLFNLAVKQLEELGYDLENTYYAVSRDSTYRIFEDNDDSPPPGISLLLTMPKLGYLGVCLQINNEQCEHKIWCNTKEQVTSVISNLDSIIKYWHQTTLKLDDLYKEQLMSDD